MRYGALFTKQSNSGSSNTRPVTRGGGGPCPFHAMAVKHSNKNSLGISNDKIPFHPLPSTMQELHAGTRCKWFRDSSHPSITTVTVQWTQHLWWNTSRKACDGTVHVTLLMIQFTQHLRRYTSRKICDGTLHVSFVEVQFKEHLGLYKSRNTSNDAVHTTLVMVWFT